MKKVLVLFLSIMVCGSLTAIVYAQQDKPAESAVVSNANQEGEEVVNADHRPLNQNPEPVLKGNSQALAKSEFKATKSSVLNEKVLEEKKGEVQLTEYMTYAEFLEFSGEGEENKSSEIADDRVVLVVQVYYPEGFEHVKAGFIENCLATGIYDAETGEYLGGSFQPLK